MELEELPVAPAPVPRELSQEEMSRLCRQREAVLRELRVFLRDATNKLLAERKFKEFTKSVDPEEVCDPSQGMALCQPHSPLHSLKQVPDYYDIITEPMDLSTVMKKIDEHQYITPSSWLTDIDLITRNALE